MTNIHNTDAIDRAVAQLRAVDIACGTYALPVGNRWRVCDEALLLDIARSNPSGSACFWTQAQLMPAWWSPEQRFAWRCWTYVDVSGPNEMGALRRHDCGTHTNYEQDVRPLIERGAHTERITASLETGEEVPA